MNISELIDRRISELGDWRGEMIARIRRLVLEAAPNIVEEWKWDTPVWSSNGNVLAVGSFQDHVKINFFRGALLDDPDHLFNAGLEAKATRAIDLSEGDAIDEAKLKNLIRAAVDLNNLKAKSPKAPAKKAAAKSTATKEKAQAAHKTDLPKLAAPAQRALAGAGIQNLKQLSKWSEAHLKELHGIGPNAVKELKQAMKAKGLSFAKPK